MTEALMRTTMLALEMYDPLLAGHSQRRALLAAALAEAASAATTGPYREWHCSPTDLDVLRCAAVLADVGYIGVRRALLERASPLLAEERRQIEAHASHSHALLRTVPWEGAYARVPEIVWAHHERMDGSGYPRGLRGPDIPVESRMIAIADTFDALVAIDRPWKKAVPAEIALHVLAEDAKGGKVDRDLLALFVDGAVWRRLPPPPPPTA
jgi:HD-GYP domain-containing protein (c-di-GMP phosphodiesterase class II)